MPDPVIVQFGLYHCGACGSPLRFDPINQGDMLHAQYAIGYCTRGHDCYDDEHMAKNCPMWNVRLKVPLERLLCDRA